jgi:hypothetical protein
MQYASLVLIAPVAGLQQAGAGSAAERLAEPLPQRPHQHQLVLDAAETEPNAVGPGVDAQRIAREALDQVRELILVERANSIVLRAGPLARGKDDDGPGAVRAELCQHAEAVFLAEAEFLRHRPANRPLRQEPLEEGRRFRRGEGPLAERQGHRQASSLGPLRRERLWQVLEAISGGTPALKRSDRLAAQMDGKLCPCSAWRRNASRLIGGVRAHESPPAHAAGVVSPPSTVSLSPSTSRTAERVSRRLVGLPVSI